MTAELKPYPTMKDSGVEWLGMVPEHWDVERAKNLFTKMERPVRERGHNVFSRRYGDSEKEAPNTESLKEIGYPEWVTVIHAMDAPVGVADSDGYAVCKPNSKANAKYHGSFVRWLVTNGF